MSAGKASRNDGEISDRALISVVEDGFGGGVLADSRLTAVLEEGRAERKADCNSADEDDLADFEGRPRVSNEVGFRFVGVV